MKLSELIAFRNQLNAMTATTVGHDADLGIGKITHLVESKPTQFGNFTQTLVENQIDIQKSFAAYDESLSKLKVEIAQQITIAENPWFQESYRLYEEEMIFETTEYILNRRPEITEETEMILRARLMNYTDWRFPGMIIRPGREKFINEMVGYDPLYLLDQSHDLLTPSMEQFPMEYQRRLRPYIINERSGDAILGKIPNNQFGVCLVYNYFNFRPFEVIKKYLAEIYEKLRPGGALIMTFNDCDRDKGVMLVERHFACYTPGYLVTELAKSIGYEQIFTWNDNGPSTWIELRRPGELTSIKGGQTLARIIAKSK